MEGKKNIYQKLQEARVELHNMQLKKSGCNKFANFYYYELGDFIPQVNKIFLEKGLIAVFNLLKETAILDIINIDNKDECVSFETPTAEVNIKGANAVQALGGCHTYLKRYLYMNALEIVEADMFDATIGREDRKETKQIKKEVAEGMITANQLRRVRGLPANLLQFGLEKLNVSKAEEMTEEQASQFLGFLEQKNLIKKENNIQLKVEEVDLNGEL